MSVSRLRCTHATFLESHLFKDLEIKEPYKEGQFRAGIALFATVKSAPAPPRTAPLAPAPTALPGRYRFMNARRRDGEPFSAEFSTPLID
ncbi:hypothetical protein EVAR_39718_1 [Eumeta japonica]|uniref:Uncharacterized protein n=1 Tax=Eumeta variegata TaxID=151549 RepID=A0A4C1W5J5_EUMVA|nr:hypothetical protein EVAR_39718_1 [Eumeta japonica]